MRTVSLDRMKNSGVARSGRRARLIAPAVLAVAMVAAGATSASAAERSITPQVVRQSTTYKVVNITRAYNQYGTQELARCDGSSGTICSIGKAKSAVRTIQTSFGLTRGTVAAGLSITAASSATVTVSCTHTITSKQVYIAYPIGTKYTYRIQKVVSTFNGISTSKNTTYSSYLTAFSPGGASIHCVLKSK